VLNTPELQDLLSDYYAKRLYERLRDVS